MQKLRIGVVGEGGVGKSSLVIRYVKGIFVEEYDPTIMNVFDKIIQLDDEKYDLFINDFVYIEERSSNAFYSPVRESHNWDHYEAAMICFDVHGSRKLEELNYDVERIKRIAEDRNRPYPFIIVGCKGDLGDEERKISDDEAMRFAESLNTEFILTSAKTYHNVEEAFLSIARRLIAAKQSASDSKPPPKSTRSARQDGKRRIACILQ